MQRLDSGGTPILNVLLPVGLFGALSVCGFMTVVLTLVFHELRILLVVGPLLLLAGVGCFFFVRWFVTRDIDEVWLDGDALFVRNRQREVRIPLADIESINYTRMRNPPLVRLKFCEPGPLGRMYQFRPQAQLPIQMPREIRELMERVNEARRGSFGS